LAPPIVHHLAPYLCSSSHVFRYQSATASLLSTLSLHDALPISSCVSATLASWPADDALSSSRFAFSSWERHNNRLAKNILPPQRSEEHTSELQSRGHLVCRLLLEKKKHEFSNIKWY